MAKKQTKYPKRRNLYALLVKSRPGGPMNGRAARERRASQVPRKGKYGDLELRDLKE